jgi:hypothetical protein
MTILVYPATASCCPSCDAVTVHFAGDHEVHVYPSMKNPGRLAARLARLVARLIEEPTVIRAIAGIADSPLVERRRR